MRMKKILDFLKENKDIEKFIRQNKDVIAKCGVVAAVIVIGSPLGNSIRPTTDKVKEALFSMLANEIPESRFLDLFSGTRTLPG